LLLVVFSKLIETETVQSWGSVLLWRSQWIYLWDVTTGQSYKWLPLSSSTEGKY